MKEREKECDCEAFELDMTVYFLLWKRKSSSSSSRAYQETCTWPDAMRGASIAQASISSPVPASIGTAVDLLNLAVPTRRRNSLSPSRQGNRQDACLALFNNSSSNYSILYWRTKINFRLISTSHLATPPSAIIDKGFSKACVRKEILRIACGLIPCLYLEILKPPFIGKIESPVLLQVK